MDRERLGEFEEMVLLCVRQLGPDAHGASILETLATTAGREATLGAIYTALDRSQRKGLVESWLGEPTSVRGGRARRQYQLTREGEVALMESRTVRDRLWKAPAGARP